jgi:hypothetical protein
VAKIHHSSSHKAAALALRALGLQPCVLCGMEIDYGVRFPHPLSFSAEHWPPLAEVGPHDHLEPAHYGCQTRQGGMIRRAHSKRDSWARSYMSGVW